MGINYRITNAAERDLWDIAHYIAQDSFNSAERFLERVEEAFNVLATMPSIGMAYSLQHSSLKDLRRWPVKQFENYLIFYRIIEETVPIEIIRVVHGARDLPSLFSPDNQTG